MADQSKEPTQQASEVERAMARQLHIHRKTGHPLDDWRDVQINYDAIGDWLGIHPRPQRARPSVPLQRCGHCRRNPVSPLEWRPWHPLMAMLCSECRSQVYILADAIAMRMGHRVIEHLGEVLTVLHLGE